MTLMRCWSRPFCVFAPFIRWQRARELQIERMDNTTPTAGSESTPATTLGDASAALALADATSAATPQATPEAPPAAAIAQPETTEGSPSTETKGEPPKWRWQDILANARETSQKEAEERIRKEYEWAKDIAPHERDGLSTWRAAMNGDPRAIAHIKQNPQAVQWLKSLVAEQQQAAAANPEPEPDLQTGTGELVYSAKQLRAWREWNNQQLTGQLEKRFEDRLKPLQETAQTFQEEKAQAMFTTNVTTSISKLASSDPDFEKHKPDVGAALQSDPQLMAMALNGHTDLALELAWHRVRNSKVLPLKQQQTEAQVLTNLQQRAVAATTNPATASTATPKPTLGNARAALEHAHAVLGS